MSAAKTSLPVLMSACLDVDLQTLGYSIAEHNALIPSLRCLDLDVAKRRKHQVWDPMRDFHLSKPCETS